MKIHMVGICAISALVLFSGCGKRLDWNDKQHAWIDPLNGDIGFIFWDDHIDPNYADWLYYQSYNAAFKSAYEYMGTSTACSKRAVALEISRRVWTYSFKTYFSLDGVSGFIYNLSYICSVPHKIVRGLTCMDGLICYCGAVVKLAMGTVAAVVGLVAASVVNTICHPCETIANLTVGLIPFDLAHGFDLGPGMTYGRYVLHTNLIATLIDIIWGAILCPLLQTFLFWV